MTILRAICFANPNKNTQVYIIFFKLFENFVLNFEFSALGVKEFPLGFDNRLLHSL